MAIIKTNNGYSISAIASISKSNQEYQPYPTNAEKKFRLESRYKNLDKEPEKVDPSQEVPQEMKDREERARQGAELLIRLKKCKPGSEWKIYEEICYDLIDWTFREEFIDPIDLSWNPIPEYKRIKNHIRDICLRNQSKDEHNNNYWNRLRNDYSAIHIIFECKNTAYKITEEEVFQLFGYLDPNSLGRFGILLTRKGQENSAVRAIDRAKLDKYKILVFDDNDIKEWIRCFVENRSVVNFFQCKDTHCSI